MVTHLCKAFACTERDRLSRICRIHTSNGLQSLQDYSPYGIVVVVVVGCYLSFSVNISMAQFRPLWWLVAIRSLLTSGCGGAYCVNALLPSSCSPRLASKEWLMKIWTGFFFWTLPLNNFCLESRWALYDSIPRSSAYLDVLTSTPVWNRVC
jgi:hypothetical protein